MTWIEALIVEIPELVSVLAPGFFLLAVFSWISSISYNNGATVIIISATLSYFVEEIAKLVFRDTFLYTILTYLLSALIGYILAIMYKSEWFGKLLARIHIKRTANKSIWDDVIGDGAWVAIYNPVTNGYYCGQFQYQNNCGGKEYLVISAYYILDSVGNITENHTNDLERKLMLDTSSLDKYIISPKDPFNHFDL